MINFSNPINGAKWLALLETHPFFGMLFKKNLEYDKSYMGFSFKSNQFGLRGPENINADTVICGTSYAMGLSVDNGKNWYELDNKYKKMFNIGMPIGLSHQKRLLDTYYQGSFHTLLFLYHPNLWIVNKNFIQAEKNNTDIFTWMRWSPSGPRVYYLYLRWLLKEAYKKATKKKIILDYKGYKYHLDVRYSYFKPDNTQVISTILEDFSALSKLFQRVIVLKVPIKEEVARKIVFNENLERLNSNYHMMWDIFHSSLNSNCKVIDLFNHFDLIDYLEQDTHWNEQGNIKLHKFIKNKTDILC